MSTYHSFGPLLTPVPITSRAEPKHCTRVAAVVAVVAGTDKVGGDTVGFGSALGAEPELHDRRPARARMRRAAVRRRTRRGCLSSGTTASQSRSAPFR